MPKNVNPPLPRSSLPILGQSLLEVGEPNPAPPTPREFRYFYIINKKEEKYFFDAVYVYK